MGNLQSKWSLPITKTIEDKRGLRIVVETKNGMSIYAKLVLIVVTSIMILGITAFLVAETAQGFVGGGL